MSKFLKPIASASTGLWRSSTSRQSWGMTLMMPVPWNWGMTIMTTAEAKDIKTY